MGDKVRLVKSEKIRLTKVAGVLRKVTSGMGWRPSGSGRSWDLDQSIIVIDNNGRYVKQISWRSKERSDEFYYHGDDLVGGSGRNLDDDEKIDINFSALDPAYERLIVIMNIYQAYEKGQDLSMVKDAYIHLWDVDAQKDLVEYPIEKSAKFRGKTGMFVGEFYKKDDEWEFQAIGEPVKVAHLNDMVDMVKRKYATHSHSEMSWEEFLSPSTATSGATQREVNNSDIQREIINSIRSGATQRESSSSTAPKRKGTFARLFEAVGEFFEELLD